jgi:predicted RNase H-like nuclease (RuvC/YqgF family)
MMDKIENLTKELQELNAKLEELKSLLNEIRHMLRKAYCLPVSHFIESEIPNHIPGITQESITCGNCRWIIL